MKGILNAIGIILLFLVLFWVIGIVTVTPTPSGATAVGDGIKAAITFFANVIKAI
jgi:hypothetical protein